MWHLSKPHPMEDNFPYLLIPLDHQFTAIQSSRSFCASVRGWPNCCVSWQVFRMAARNKKDDQLKAEPLFLPTWARMEWVEKLKTRLQLPLPGPAAHESLRATPVGQPMPDFGHRLPPKPGGVLILLYEEGGMVKFPLTKRQEYPGAHSGQISFPGGKAEPGESGIQTALREAHEEIGVGLEGIEVLGTLTNFFVIPSNFMVTPVVAYSPVVPAFVRSEYEVARILTCRVSDLLKEDAVTESEILAAGKIRMLAPHFELEGEMVWGATAMMLNEFRLVWRDVVTV